MLKRETRLLHGTYQFPQYDRKEHSLPKRAKKLGSVVHHYSHFTFEGDVYQVSTKPEGNGKWYNAKGIAKLPLSGVEKKVLALVS